jgi:hypothetical protein
LIFCITIGNNKFVNYFPYLKSYLSLVKGLNFKAIYFSVIELHVDSSGKGAESSSSFELVKHRKSGVLEIIHVFEKNKCMFGFTLELHCASKIITSQCAQCYHNSAAKRND